MHRKKITKAEAASHALSSSSATAAAPAPAAAPEAAGKADTAASSSAYVRGLEEKLEYHRKVIRLYQNLSSLAIHPKEKKQGV